MIARRLLSWAAAAALALACSVPGHAARSHAWSQAPAVGTLLDMGSTQTLTYQISNTSTGGNAGERICEIRFRIATGSLFSAATAAPAGWTMTAFSTTSMTFRANSWANAIAVGTPAGFPLAITMRTTTADVDETLLDIRVRYTSDTTGPPFADAGGAPSDLPGGWRLVSLAITSFQITDLAGAPITSLIAGTSFRLAMTVKNNSSLTQLGIVSNPNPPAAVKTGTVTQALTATAGSPLNLTAGSSGTIVFTFSTAATDNGTIRFTAQARAGAAVTSRTATSTTLSVGRFLASVTPSTLCQYAGSNITVTMALTDAYPFDILGVTPSLVPLAGAPVTLLSGPLPAAPIATVPASPPDTPVTWTYQVNAVGATNPFTFSGAATGTADTAGSPVLSTPTATTASIRRGSFAATINPAVVNAGSTNVELAVNVTNDGCAAVNSVSIMPGAGWTAAGDAYSLVNLSAVSAVETWTAAGVGAVTFSAPNVASQLPLTFAGSFALVFAATPPAAGASAFTIRVTDANGQFVDIPLGVTVNAFKSGSLNDAASRLWREDYR